jgi:hypothetical protein
MNKLKLSDPKTWLNGNRCLGFWIFLFTCGVSATAAISCLSLQNSICFASWLFFMHANLLMVFVTLIFEELARLNYKINLFVDKEGNLRSPFKHEK